MPEPADTRRTIGPDDRLPPVEPPNAGFIVQLFVAPLIIVVIVVLVWLSFNWLAHMGNNPERYVETIKKDNAVSWQAANDLAELLRRGDDLKQNAPLARELAALLEQQLEAGGMDENDLLMRVFLAKTLGEFQVSDGLPVLLKAAELERDEKERAVRRAAIEAIALLADNLRRAKAGEKPLVAASAVMVRTAGDDDELIRSSSAYALGVIGGKPARDKLARMLVDAYPDVRYNAATGLARHGDRRSLEVLVEMLDPRQTAGIKSEEEAAREFKRTSIVINALRAGEQLAEAAPSADLAPLRSAVQRLNVEKFGGAIRIHADRLLRLLNERKETSVERT